MDHQLPPSLAQGYQRFRAVRYAAERERYRALGEGTQSPRAMIVACSDSRAAPETIFDAGPGELFVVRNVAALVPGYAPDEGQHGASAALEFAVRTLGVPAIVVMGHGRCGGVAAAVAGPDLLATTDFVGRWVGDLRRLADTVPLGDGDPASRQRDVEHRSIERSIRNLRTFPWIAEREADGSLALHGAWFDIALGELHELGPAGWVRSLDE